ncbi:glycosyltransferase family 2 protein [Aulographum hederae CBS 113979]|uniref:Glycosyltransferase family 2 protein n=1 Tax=Aulographum hederae CBS 113979 TaxID=1176131 RepID=A0A6G1GWR4_9PEZI|nr:glycosyltransferase family 2 protein [Aulographum hederae CBS 113979]
MAPDEEKGQIPAVSRPDIAHVGSARGPGDWTVKIGLRSASTLASVASIAYFYHRAVSIYGAPDFNWVYVVVFLIELDFSVTRILNYVLVHWIARNYSSRRQQKLLIGMDVPTIDISITCCGEPLDVALDTIQAVCNLEYPTDRYRVYILDDGNNSQLKARVTDLGLVYPYLHYAARGKEVKTHSKAANLNFGMTLTGKDKPSEYMAVLDVDMIPEPKWLRKLLPHILEDPQTVMANPPQHFYNVPRNDHLGSALEWRYVADVIMPLQDAIGAAWCTGSGFVVKRSAIVEIGGYPEECLQEDNLTSNLLAARGMKVAFVNEQVQWGLAPESLAVMVKQRCRLAVGNISMITFHLFEKIEGLTLHSRFHGIMASMIYVWSMFGNTISMILLLGLLFAGVPLMPFSRTLLALSILDFCAQVCFGLFETHLTARRTHVLSHFQLIWMDPYRFGTALGLLSARCPSFSPTGTKKSGSFLSKPFMGHEIRSIFHIAGLLLLIAAGMSSVISVPQKTIPELLTRIGSPAIFILWAALVANSMVPVYFTYGKSQLVPRESLLETHTATGVRYPSKQAKENDKAPVKEHHLLVCMAWCAIVAAFLFLTA